MKKKFIVCLLAVAVAALSSFGCGDHACSYTYFFVGAPTCESCGLAERTCTECGAKDYVELEKLGHAYGADGKCTRCGLTREGIAVTDKSAFFTVDSVVEKIARWDSGYTKEKLIMTLTDIEIDDVYVNGLGRLAATIDGKSGSIGGVRKAYEMEESGEAVGICKLATSRGELYVYDSMGTVYDVGTTNFYGGAYVGVVGLMVNEQDVLIALYSNDTVRAVGTMATKKSDVSATDLVIGLSSVGNHCYLAGVSGGVERVKLPQSHLGKPVNEVGCDALRNCKTVKSLDLNVDGLYVGNDAFYGCSALESVVLPLEFEIRQYAFGGCTALSKVFYAGSAMQWRACEFLHGNESLLTATTYYYSESEQQSGGNFWRYADGLPTHWN